MSSKKDLNGNFVLPSWVKEELFGDILKKEVEGFVGVKSFRVEPGSSNGENYMSIILRVTIWVELTDGALKDEYYLLKVGYPTNATGSDKVDALGAFNRENEMYSTYIPAFEKLYADKGKHVKFAPKSFRFTEDPGIDNIVLEDLKVGNFKNANRLEGLDEKHTKSVLKLLAEFHASSAVYYELNGPYPDTISVGIFKEDLIPMFLEFNLGIKSVLKPLMISLKDYKNGKYFAEKLFKENYEAYYRKGHAQVAKVHKTSFNVINHGDIWSNNIMFSYDQKNNIKGTLFVDFQMCKYGSPFYDLFYFLLSSVASDIKLSKFDYFIKFYHECLTENLTLLEYPQSFPTLQHLHEMLLQNGFGAVMTVTGLLGTVLLDPTDTESMGNFFSDEEGANTFRKMIYKNPKYIKALNDILPWLDNRGFLD